MSTSILWAVPEHSTRCFSNEYFFHVPKNWVICRLVQATYIELHPLQLTLYITFNFNFILKYDFRLGKDVHNFLAVITI